MSKGEKGLLFVRPASGLVKAIGPIGGLALSLPAAIGPLQLTLHPQLFAMYPGVDILLSFILASVIVLVEAFVAMELGAAMPRSGGLYVADGRVLGPFWGGIEGWRAVIQNGFFNGLTSFLTGGTIGTLLSVMGNLTENTMLAGAGEAILGSVPLMLLVGAAIITVGALVDLMGPRFMSSYMFLFSLIGIICLIPGLAGLFSTPLSVTKSSWDAKFGSGAYDEIVSVAQTNGWSSGAWSWETQLMSITFPFLIMIGYNPLMLGGELSRPKKTFPIACMGSALTVCVLNTLSIAGLQYSYGSFISQYSFLQFNGLLGTLNLNSGVPVSTVFFASVHLPPILAAVTLLTPIFGQIAYMPMATFYTSRSLFALSFDKMAPELFASTSRWGSPKNSILFFFITSLIGLGISQVALDVALLNVLVLYTFTRLLFIMSATIMPAVRPEIWEKGFAWTIGGVPVISIVGSIVSIPVAVILLMSCIGLDLLSILLIVGILTAGGILFLLYSLLNKRRGINVGNIYGAIPPD